MTLTARGLCAATVGMVLGVAGVALAGGGNLLPAGAKSKGYSLADMAGITAYYNSYFVTFGPSPTNPPPAVPFQIIEDDVTVKPGTSFYVPIYYADDAGGAPPGFPANVGDQAMDAAYLETLVFDTYGITALFLEVDGQITTLDGSYVSGAVSKTPLVDGSTLGSRYICSAAFLTPMTPGAHTLNIGGIIDGQPVVFLTHTITVR